MKKDRFAEHETEHHKSSCYTDDDLRLFSHFMSGSHLTGNSHTFDVHRATCDLCADLTFDTALALLDRFELHCEACDNCAAAFGRLLSDKALESFHHDTTDLAAQFHNRLNDRLKHVDIPEVPRLKGPW